MINKKLLLKFDAQIKTFTKNEFIFYQQDYARNYYQIDSGIVKMNNFNESGKEFIQGFFYKGQSFGEPPLFIDVKYPANAQTTTPTTLLILSKENLLKLLYQHPEIHLNITKSLAKKLYYKAIIASEIFNQNSKHSILRFIDYLKQEVYKVNGAYTFKVPYTRQQIADILGLRVETVIRNIKTLEAKRELQIINGKIFR